MNTDGIDMIPEDENVEYHFTPYGCLLSVMKDYNIDVSHITPKMAEHLFEDFMECLIRQGYVGRRKDDEQS